MTPTALVVGASVGGARTAQALRKTGYDGRVVLVGAEPHLPYDKPPLSKAALLDEDAQAAPLLTAGQAAEAGITLELGVAAESLDVAGRRVTLADGRRIDYDDVVLATGAHARPSPWGEHDGLHVLRTLEDAVRLRADLHRGGRLVVVGGGFIGAEVASAARMIGMDVTIVDPLAVPMSRALGDEVGRLFADLHARHSVQTRFGTGVEDVRPHAGGLQVVLTDGSTLEADTVVVGIGATPNTGWLDSSGLLLEDGVVCDEFSRALHQPHVHAVGDLARWHHPRHDALVRVEHWTNAVDQASCVAHNITSPEDLRPYAPVEYVWSDQYDWKIQIAGCPWRGASEVVLGDPAADRRFAALWADGDGRLCGAMSVNWPKATVQSRRALANGASLESVRDGLVASAAGVAR